MKKSLLILFAILFGSTIYAQTYSISGKVYNDPNAGNIDSSVTTFSLPLEGILIVLVELNGDTITHTTPVNASNGNFTIAGVKPGSYYAMVITPNDNLLRGDPSPHVILETGWTRTGESLLASGVPDASTNGKTGTITITSSNISNVKFGIQERPFARDKMNNQLNNTSITPIALSINTSSDFTDGGASILEGADNDGGTITNYTINVLPKFGKLYLGTTQITSLEQVDSLSTADFATLKYLPGAAAINQDQDFFTYYATDNALTKSNNATYVIPFPLLDGDNDTYANRNDLDDDNDGITDVLECPLNDFTTLVTAYYNNEFTFIRPSMFGYSPAQRTGLNISADLSSSFGYPANSGAIIVTVSNANTHPTANEFYVNDSTGPSQWTVSGTIGAYATVEHGLQYFSYDTRTITIQNGTPKKFSMGQSGLDPVDGKWQSGNDDYSWWLKSDTTLRMSTINLNSNPRQGALGFALIDPEPKYFTFASTANNRDEWATYFVRLLPECDYDMDGVPNRLDLDSDNDGCLDALEGSAGFDYPNISNSGGSVWVGFGSIAENQNLCASATCVDGNGIPLVSSGGQTANNTYNETEISPACATLLPVQLTSFEVIKKDNSAYLSWTTASELNNKGFEIQRSNDGINWEVISFVTGGGNSNSPLYYNFTDKIQNVGDTYFYRLKQIDFDNQFELLPVRSITFESKRNGNINWYPNPSYGDIKFERNEDLNKIVISDALGRQIFSIDALNLIGNDLNLRSIPSGTYFISFITNTDIYTDKLVIQK